MRRAFVLLTLALATMGVPQPTARTAPVTRADLYVATMRVEGAMRVVLRMPASTPAARSEVAGPATRAEVTAELDRMFEVFRPQFRWTPMPYRVVEPAIDERNPDPKTREQLRRLARWGMIGPVGPLVTGPEPTLTEDELGATLGYFMGQIASLTYQPDARWTPNLMTPEDGSWGTPPTKD